MKNKWVIILWEWWCWCGAFVGRGRRKSNDWACTCFTSTRETPQKRHLNLCYYTFLLLYFFLIVCLDCRVWIQYMTNSYINPLMIMKAETVYLFFPHLVSEFCFTYANMLEPVMFLLLLSINIICLFLKLGEKDSVAIWLTLKT